MPTDIENHIHRLTMEADSKVQNPLEDATVYINCAVYENGLLESSTQQTLKTDLCADKKIHFIEKSIERTVMSSDQENNKYNYMNGDCTEDELKKFENGPYVAKTRVFQTQEIRITKVRRPLAQRQENEPSKVTDDDLCKVSREVKNDISEVTEVSKVADQDKVEKMETCPVLTQEQEMTSNKHKPQRSSAEEPPRKKRYLCKDIMMPPNGLIWNQGLTYPTTKLRLQAKSWALPHGSNPDADKIAEIVYTTFRPRVQKDKHIRLLFPPPYHPKDPEPEVQVQVVPPVEEKPEEVRVENDVGAIKEEEEEEDDVRMSKRGRKKKNWFQRVWHNLRSQFRANDNRQS